MRDFNFFAPFQGEKKQSVNKKIYFYTLAIVVGGFVVISFGWNMFNLYKLEHDIKKLNTTLNSSNVQDKVKKAEDINKKLSILGKYDEGLLQVGEAIEGRNMVNSQILKKLNSTLPDEVSFKSITIGGSSISIQALAQTRTAIAEFEHNIKELDIISDAQIGAINSDGANDSQYSFDIKCSLKDVDTK